MKRILWLTIVLGSTNSALANSILLGIPADTWYRVQKTSLLSVAPASEELSDKGIRCVVGPMAVVSARSGGAYDSIRHKMLVWGGGHADYCGNELYAFDIDKLKWERLTEPSLPPFNRDPLDDGAPVSRHTYDGLQFLEHADRFWAYGGGRSKDGAGTNVTWVFQAGDKRWTDMNPAGTHKPGLGHIYNLSSGYDPISHKVFMFDPYYLYSYDIDTNRWTRLKNWTHNWGQQRGVVDPKRRLYFTVGMGEFQVYDIGADRDVSDQWMTRGGEEIISAPAPGVDYDGKADALVGWKGGAVYVLDMNSKVWTRKSGQGAPAIQSERGTYGRWRYIPEYSIFILVNSAVDDVCFYKHTAGGPREAAAPVAQPKR